MGDPALQTSDVQLLERLSQRLLVEIAEQLLVETLVFSLGFAGDRVNIELLTWRRVRLTKTDTPTRLEDLLFEITHPPSIHGWHFQGTNGNGQSHEFDIRRSAVAEWKLVRAYD